MKECCCRKTKSHEAPCLIYFFIYFYAGVIILNKNSDERFMAEIKI